VSACWKFTLWSAGYGYTGGGELASLLTTYNLSYIINFATRIQNNSSPASDNIFVDKSRINLSSIPPTTNGLSDHNAQILTIKNIYATISKFL
jgi:hypothetical protein